MLEKLSETDDKLMEKYLTAAGPAVGDTGTARPSTGAAARTATPPAAAGRTWASASQAARHAAAGRLRGSMSKG